MQFLTYSYHHHRLAIPHRSPSHYQTKLDSQSGIRATNRSSYLAATASRLSMQSSKGWHNQDPDLRVGTQALLKGEEGKTMILVKVILWLC